ncbi:MAG: DNA-processing protein DprA [bacterium]|nr:DNA-processing protein DprA [bacterium]
MEEIGLIEFVLLHASTCNPGLALEVIAKVPRSELALIGQGKVLPHWPQQNWLHSILPEIERLSLVYRHARPQFQFIAENWLTDYWSEADPKPLALWQRGPLIAGPYLVVVGPRRPSQYAQTQTEKLVRLVSRERVLVSGLAYGIDMLALRAAISAGGRVVAVVPFGVANIYPAGHRAELEEWVKQGRAMILSEYWSVAKPCKLHFWWRNRLMAAMADWLFIPEAAVKSGTRKTAEYALNQSKSLAVLPADITRVSAAYSNQLIAAGAVTICNYEDWFQFCNVRPQVQSLPLKYRALASVLQRGCFEPESILANLNIGPAQFWQLIQEAEVDMIVRREPGGTVTLLSDS